jgi:hypothetical protein
VNGRVAGHSGEGGDDLGGQAFHVLGLVEERGEEDQVGAGLGHLARSTYAVLRRPGDRDRRQGLAELAVEADQRDGDPPSARSPSSSTAM